ncbi:UNVERIFIED_CONTAM: hypothetical protein K2H54_057903 [Gekko kuhli]
MHTHTYSHKCLKGKKNKQCVTTKCSLSGSQSNGKQGCIYQTRPTICNQTKPKPLCSLEEWPPVGTGLQHQSLPYVSHNSRGINKKGHNSPPSRIPKRRNPLKNGKGGMLAIGLAVNHFKL